MVCGSFFPNHHDPHLTPHPPPGFRLQVCRMSHIVFCSSPPRDSEHGERIPTSSPEATDDSIRSPSNVSVLEETSVLNTPLALHENATQTDGFEPKDSKSRYRRFAADMKKNVLGPMPPQDFMDNFMPDRKGSDRSGRLSSKGAFKKVPERAEHESLIYDPLVSSNFIIAMLYAPTTNGLEDRST